jgi:hypothetical protein
VERFLSLLLSAAQRSKWGLLLIVVGSIWLFGMLMVGLVSTAGNVILVANGMKPVLQFLGSGLGIPAFSLHVSPATSISKHATQLIPAPL